MALGICHGEQRENGGGPGLRENVPTAKLSGLFQAIHGAAATPLGDVLRRGRKFPGYRGSI